MKKFKYRLEALLKVKEHIEKERQKALAISSLKVNEQVESLGVIENSRVGTLHTQANRMTGKISVAEMLIYGRYILKLKRDTLTGREMLKVLKKEESQKRNELLDASRERQVYEKLKAKKQDRFVKEVASTEMKANDEVAISNYRRRSD